MGHQVGKAGGATSNGWIPSPQSPFAKDPRIRQHLKVVGVLGSGGGMGPHTLPIDPAWENVGEFRNQSHIGSGFVCGCSKLGLLRSESQAAWLRTRETMFL